MLSKYSLDSLNIDVTMVKIKAKLLKRGLTKDDFFVIEVDIIGDTERRLYKISLDLLSVEQVNDEDYYRVHITLNSLQSLGLCMVEDNTYTGDTYLHEEFHKYMSLCSDTPVSHTTLFNRHAMYAM
jgi:hypothetical protein